MSRRRTTVGSSVSSSECLFCSQSGGEEVWADDRCRVVWPNDPDHPGLCRVVWADHSREMTDLVLADRDHLMRVVFVLEQVIRELLSPEKMNLACLGNAVPHIHWHVVPRYVDDPHFPGAIWGPKLRDKKSVVPENFSASLRSQLAIRLPS